MDRPHSRKSEIEAESEMPTHRPFPGMDPFIESNEDMWTGFHTLFIGKILGQLNADGSLPKKYLAMLERRGDTTITSMEGEEIQSQYRSDTQVRKSPNFRKDVSAGITALADLPTRKIELEQAKPSARVQILTKGDGKLVTWIEMLSPANKKGSGWEQSIAKRDRLIKKKVNYVEIDLLRGGDRTVDAKENADFLAYYMRVGEESAAACYDMYVSKRLSRISIPLLRDDPDVTLDLQAIMEECYQNARYVDAINYNTELKVPFEDGMAKWVRRRTKPYMH